MPVDIFVVGDVVVAAVDAFVVVVVVVIVVRDIERFAVIFEVFFVVCVDRRVWFFVGNTVVDVAAAFVVVVVDFDNAVAVVAINIAVVEVVDDVRVGRGRHKGFEGGSVTPLKFISQKLVIRDVIFNNVVDVVVVHVVVDSIAVVCFVSWIVDANFLVHFLAVVAKRELMCIQIIIVSFVIVDVVAVVVDVVAVVVYVVVCCIGKLLIT